MSPARGGDTHFSKADNWSKGSVPGSGDTVIFDADHDGDAACILDADATVGAIMFRNTYASLFDFNGHFLTITGDFADFRSRGMIDGTKNSGGIVFSGSAIQHFFPGKAHFPCITVQGRRTQMVVCREIGMLVDTLVINSGSLYFGDGLAHLCGEIRGTGGFLDFAAASVSVSQAGIFLSGSAFLSARRGILICTGSRLQRIEVTQDTLPVHAFVQHCEAGCVFGNKSGPCIAIDSLTIRSGSLTLGQSQCLTVGTLEAVHGGLKIPASSRLIIRKSIDFSGLDTIDMDGLLAFSGESMVLFSQAGMHLASISLLRGKVTMAGNGCDADWLNFFDNEKPCTLSLGSHLTHTFHRITAHAGSVIDFGTSILRYIGDTLDLSSCGVAAAASDEGSLALCGTNPQVFIASKSAVYPGLILNSTDGALIGKNGFSCRRLGLLSGTFHLGAGLSHTVSGLLRVSGGGLDFGTSTLNVAADTVDFTGANDLVPANGVLSFIGDRGTQVFLPRKDVLHPDISKSQSGTVRIMGTLAAKKFFMSGGTFDQGNGRCQFTGFSAKGGTFITGKDSLIITGNANFSGLADLVPGRAPVVVRSMGNASVASFSSTTHTVRHLVLSAIPSLEGVAKIIAGKGIHRVTRLTFQWNRSADSAVFDFRQNNAGIVAEDSVDVRPVNSGIDKGVIFMGGGTWTFGGDVMMKNFIGDSSTVIFSRTSGRQTIDAQQTFNNVIHSGGGTLALVKGLACRNFTQSGGTLDLKGGTISALNDFSLLNGPSSSIAASPVAWKIKAGRNVYLSGSPDSLLTIGSAPGCTLSAGVSLTVRYCMLKRCAADQKKGIAYNSLDSTGNSNWTFMTKPLPIRISPIDISFGFLSAGASRDTVVTLSNICSDTVTIFLVQPSSPSFSSRIESLKIAPHHAIKDTIAFSPADAGPDSGCIVITSNAESSPDTVRLSGIGKGPRLHCSADTVSFGKIIGLRPLYRTIVIKNTGTDTLQLSQSIETIRMESGLDSVFSASGVRACAPQDSCVDTIRFLPKKTGDFSALLIVKSNARFSRDTIVLIASGTTAAESEPKVIVPSDYAFQEVAAMEKSVVFKYGLPVTSKVTLEIYDAIGRILERPIESVFGPSEYHFTWDASHLSRGIYFCRLRATDQSGTGNDFVKILRVVFSK